MVNKELDDEKKTKDVKEGPSGEKVSKKVSEMSEEEILSCFSYFQLFKISMGEFLNLCKHSLYLLIFIFYVFMMCYGDRIL